MTHTTAEYELDGQHGVRRRRRPPMTRGLNRHHNRVVKNVFKSAATAAATRTGPLHDWYQGLLTRGMREELARVTLARKLASRRTRKSVRSTGQIESQIEPWLASRDPGACDPLVGPSLIGGCRCGSQLRDDRRGGQSHAPITHRGCLPTRNRESDQPARRARLTITLIERPSSAAKHSYRSAREARTINSDALSAATIVRMPLGEASW